MDYYTGRVTSYPVRGNTDYYAVLRSSASVDSYMLETVFHTNYQDATVYLNNQQALATTIMNRMAAEYNLVKTK